MTSQEWDREYRRGDWDYLSRASERPRYAVLAERIDARFLSGGGDVLDLGCGSGILRERLADPSVASYTGVDVSGEAVALAERRAYPRSNFIAASIDQWEPNRPYDAIVFNEVLYYLPQPLESMRRFERWLASDGSLYVSMWHPSTLLRLIGPRRTKVGMARRLHGLIWTEIDRAYDVVADLTTQSNRLQRWRIQELRPARPSS
jgi:2-polyprenyl-3-methyl-5-hydroxy-6-metoxy-1,4-benzoquinol methylase